MEESMIFICECHSYDHQAIFSKDEENKQLFVSIHLNTNRNFFKRIWYAMKYVFGYKSKFGDWDEFFI